MAVKKVSTYQGLVAAAALLALPAIAHAQGMPAQVDPRGLYIGGAVGISIPSDSDLDTPGVSREASLEPGAAIAAALGYHWGWGIKTEVEGQLRLSRLDGITGVTGATGDFDVVGIMGNIIYEPSLGWVVRPFIGGGIGYGIAQASNIAPVAGSRVGDSDGGLAWQIMAGIGFNVAPEWTVQVGYRYFNMPDVDFKTDSGVGVSSDYSAHTAMVGLRYHFNVPTPAPAPAAAAPPPPPAAAPAPPPAQPARAPRQYIVFFDFDSARLTDQARNIIRQAADAARRDGYARIDLTGHADRSGSDRYNLRLSQRRADAVKAELQRLGIRPNEIQTAARGESQPLVQTRDGVREPQNRRVEIVIVDRR